MANTLAVTKDTNMNTILEALGYKSDSPSEGTYTQFRRAYGVDIGRQIGNRYSRFSSKLIGYRISLDWSLRVRHASVPFKVATVKDGILDLDEFKAKLDVIIAEATRRKESQQAGEVREAENKVKRLAILAELGLEPYFQDGTRGTLRSGKVDVIVQIGSGAESISIEAEYVTKAQAKVILEAIKGLKS